MNYMTKRLREVIVTPYLLLFTLLMLPVSVSAQLTLDSCQAMAQANYPLIKKYDMISRMKEYTLSNISKGWLPQITATLQATLQNNVSNMPSQLTSMTTQSGINYKGMGKAQYKVGVDVSQTIWEGGRINAALKVEQARIEVEQAQINTDMYGIRKRVNDLFFGILLTDERLKVNADLQTLLHSDIDKLESMVKNGVAMQSDVDEIQAELMSAKQSATELQAARKQYANMLGLLCGTDKIQTSTLDFDDYGISKNINAQGLECNKDSIYAQNRPELALINKNIQLTYLQEKQLKSGLMPILSIFAQGFYGYPGYDSFEAMMKRDLTWNGMIGAKLTWNIGNLYTNKNDKKKLQIQREYNENQREVFLFNNKLDQTESREQIERYKKLSMEDDNIVSLRKNVRIATEKKLAHGIINSNDLIQQITKENNARNDKVIHQIQMLSEIYDLKYIIN